MSTGVKIAIKSVRSGKWCADDSRESGSIICNRDKITAHEEFTVTAIAPDVIALRGGRTNAFCQDRDPRRHSWTTIFGGAPWVKCHGSCIDKSHTFHVIRAKDRWNTYGFLGGGWKYESYYSKPDDWGSTTRVKKDPNLCRVDDDWMMRCTDHDLEFQEADMYKIYKLNCSDDEPRAKADTFDWKRGDEQGTTTFSMFKRQIKNPYEKFIGIDGGGTVCGI